MPGRASRSALLALLISTSLVSAAAAAAAGAAPFFAFLGAVWAMPMPLRTPNITAKTSIREMRFLRIVMNSPFQLFLLGFVFVFFVAGLDGVGFAHILSVFGFAIPASALMINAAVEVDPYLAGLRGRWRRGGGRSCATRGAGGGRLVGRGARE